MRDVAIIGIGQTPVSEHWDRSLRDLASAAVLDALADAGNPDVGALYVGNMLSGQLTGQENVATVVADAAGLLPIEAIKIEAACAAGGAAIRAAWLAVASGAHDCVVAAGVEKMTDHFNDAVSAALATAADADFEAGHGVSFVALNALLMRRYMHQYGVRREDFAPFSINSHRNAARNPHAMFRAPIDLDDYMGSPVVADPIGILDSAGICDGAAALVLCPLDRAERYPGAAVRIAASACATDTVGLCERADPLRWQAIVDSARRAYDQSGLGPDDIDAFELHDAFTIVSALSLEACGFAVPGEGIRWAADEAIGTRGRLPISTMGGLKGRGHPIGASGVYQAVEAVQQLRGQAGESQVPGVHTVMTQSVGGSGSVAVTHILQSVNGDASTARAAAR
ncbi:MAG: thiolase domain-containing protein [Acidobacteriota bacterium]|jgi:acetyl-CoA C-acetyltransferase